MSYRVAVFFALKAMTGQENVKSSSVLLRGFIMYSLAASGGADVNCLRRISILFDGVPDRFTQS